jgi:hypothetical protein
VFALCRRLGAHCAVFRQAERQLHGSHGLIRNIAER